jgi:predicted chitinase
MATGVKEGQQYVVDGAIFKCQYGSAPCQIMAISNQKVTAQGKVIVTDKDVTFKLPSAPFVTCSQNTQVPTCVYANGIWKTKTTVQHGDQNAIVEKSVMKCPVYQGEIKCIYPGQVQSVSAPELAEFKIETLSNFPLAMEVSYNTPPKEDTPQKTSGVNAVSVSPQTFRAGEEIIIHAFSDSNYANELVAPKHVNWVVTTTKEGEKTEGTGKKAKTVKAKYLNSLMIFKQVCPPFKIILNEPGKYIIEGGSDGILDGNKTIVGYNKIDIQKPLEGKNKIPMYKKCAVELEIVNGNSITDIKKAGDKKAISDTDTVYVKQGVSAVFTPEFKLDYNPDFEQLKCSVTKQNGEGVVDGDYKFDEGGHSLTLTPSSAEVDYRITFSLYKKTDETIEETPMSEKSILVHSYNEAVLYAYVPGATKGSANGNTTLRRPGDTLIFTVKQKDGKAEDLDKIVWNVKKDGKLFEKDIKGEMILYKFKQEGVYTIEADLKGTLLSNGGVKENILTDFDEESANPENKNVVVLDELNKSLVNEEGKGDSGKSVNGENHKERVITHKLKISRNEVTGVRLGATNGKRYVGVRYTIEPSFLFGDATYRDERNNVVYTCEGADAYCLKRGIFLATKPGDYIVKATLNGKECKSQPFTIQDATFSKWEFCDSEKKKISYIGRNMTFGINASVPAWAQTSGDEKKNNKEITVSIFCKNKAIQSFKTKLDEAGSFHIDNIDVEKDIIANAKNTVSFDGIQDLIITFVVNDYPSKIVKGLSISKVGHGLFSTKANLTVKTKPFIDGYFADKNGKKIVELLSYDDEVYVHLQMLNQSKNTLEKLRLRVYENKYGMDPVVYEAEHITLNKDNSVDIKIEIKKEVKDSELDNLKFSGKEASEKSSLPRMFYFMVVETDDYGIVKKSRWAYIDDFYKRFVYPPHPGDLYNLNSEELKALVDSEEQELKKSNPEFQKRSKARNHYYQLKLVSKKEDNEYANTYNHLAPVVVGEDWEEEEKKEESGCKCPRCNEEAKELEKRLKKMFVNASSDAIKTVAETYCKYQRRFGMDSCWIKAHFFAQVYVESSSLTGKTESMDFSAKNLFIGNPNLSYFKGKWERCKKYGRISQKKKNGIYDDLPEDKQDCKDFHKAEQREIANLAYATRPGNEGGEDGWNYRGRGLIQLTGKGTYGDVGKIMKVFGMDKEGFECDLVNNRDLVASNLELAVVASMAYFHYKNCNMHSLCNGNMNVNEISKQVGQNDWAARKLAFDGIKKEENGNETKDDKCTYKIFELDNCEWDKIDCPDDVPSYHTFFGGRVEKHIPKGCDEKKATHYIFYYHKEDGTCVEICRRTIVRNEGLCKVKLEKKGKEKVLYPIPKDKDPNLKTIYTYPNNTNIDGDKIYVMSNGDKYVSDKEKHKGEACRYQKDGDEAIELVRIDEGCTGGLFQFNKEGVKLYYQIDTYQTARFYSDPNVFAILIGILAEVGANEDYDIKFRGTGNAEIYGTGYPSQTHVNGMSLDFCYSDEKEDPDEVKLSKDIALLKAGIKFKCKTRYTGTWNSRKGGREIYSSKPEGDQNHNNHIHLGPFNQEYNKPTIIKKE